MAKPFRLLREAIEADPERQARVRDYRRAMRDAIELGKLRDACGVTQKEVAATLGMSQANVSRIEHEEDLYLSTLRDYIAALGGRLELTAVFPDQTVQLVPGSNRSEDPDGGADVGPSVGSSSA